MQQVQRGLLEHRTPVGLWGGLSCSPLFASEEELRKAMRLRGIADRHLRQMIAFRHTFSHFHLDIVPMWLDLPSPRAAMDDGPGLWYNLAQPPSVGLAAPVERLLQQLRQPQQMVLSARATEEEEE